MLLGCVNVLAQDNNGEQNTSQTVTALPAPKPTATESKPKVDQNQIAANDWKKKYNQILSKNDNEIVSADLLDIQNAIDAYDKLGSSIKKLLEKESNLLNHLKNIAEGKDDEEKAIAALNAEIENWKENHKVILEKSMDANSIVAGDSPKINDAIAAYNSLTDEAKSELSQEYEILKQAKEIAESKAGETLPEANNELPQSVLIIGIVLIVLIVLLYIIVFVSKRKREENIIKAISESDDRAFNKKILSIVMENYAFREMLLSEINKAVGSSRSNEGEITSLQRRVTSLEDSMKKASSTPNKANAPVSESAPTMQQPVVAKSMYAESIVDKKFIRVKSSATDDAIFELKLNGDKRATVTIYERSYNKVLANPSFLEGCSSQVLGGNTVCIESEGIAEKDDNGKWMLVEPIKVVLK